MRYLLSILLLAGCVSFPPSTAGGRDETLKEHPRALLLQNTMPSCVWWCTSTTTVTNSEGVKAQGTGGNLSTNEAQSSTSSTTQTYAPSVSTPP